MTPLWPHVPPRGVGASARTCTGPPDASTVLSFPLAKNPTDRLSGDQNGNCAPSVEARDVAMPVRRDCTHSLPAPKATFSPSGEMARGAAFVAGQPEGRAFGRDEVGVDRLRVDAAPAEELAAEVDVPRRRRAATAQARRPRPHPTPSARRGARESGRETGLRALGDPAQLPFQVRRGLPALVGILGEARLHDAVERGRRHRLQLRDRLRLVAQDRGDEGRLRGAGEGLLARRHLVEHGAEGEDVGARVGVLALELLGRHVLERAEDRAFLREVGLRRQRREAPRRRAVRRRREALRAGRSRAASRPSFVSMTLPGFRSRWTIPCRCALSSASAISTPKRSVWSSGSAPLREPVRQRLAFEQLHDEVLGVALVADVVERADVRVRELRDRLRLALEALADLGRLREVLRAGP